MQIHIIKDIAQRSTVVQQEETRLINGIKKIRKIKRKMCWKKKDAEDSGICSDKVKIRDEC